MSKFYFNIFTFHLNNLKSISGTLRKPTNELIEFETGESKAESFY